MKLKQYLNESIPKGVLKNVHKFLNSQRTWFQDDDSDEKTVVFTTRDNGDVGSEEPGEEDFKEAQRLAKLVRKKFKNKVNVQIDDVDEWTFLEVTEK